MRMARTSGPVRGTLCGWLPTTVSGRSMTRRSGSLSWVKPGATGLVQMMVRSSPVGRVEVSTLLKTAKPTGLVWAGQRDAASRTRSSGLAALSKVGTRVATIASTAGAVKLGWGDRKAWFRHAWHSALVLIGFVGRIGFAVFVEVFAGDAGSVEGELDWWGVAGGNFEFARLRIQFVLGHGLRPDFELVLAGRDVGDLEAAVAAGDGEVGRPQDHDCGAHFGMDVAENERDSG